MHKGLGTEVRQPGTICIVLLSVASLSVITCTACIRSCPVMQRKGQNTNAVHGVQRVPIQPLKN